MAVYPCDWSGHRYPQPQQSVYFTTVLGELVQTYKLRLCPKHFRDEAAYIQEHMAMVDENSQVSKTCEWCDADRTCSLYAKVFPAKTEEQDFAVDLCAAHMAEVRDNLQILNGHRLSAP